MGMDFLVGVKVKTTGADAVDKLEKQLEKIKSTKITVDVNTVGANLGSLEKSVNSLSKKKISLKTDSVNTAKVISDFKLLKSLASEISQKKIRLAGLDPSKNSNQISELSTQLKKLETEYNQLYTTMSKSLSTTEISSLNQILRKTDDRISEIKASAKDMGEAMSAASKPFNELDALTASNKTMTWLKNNTRAAKDYGNELTELAQKQKNATSTDELRKYNKEVNRIKTEASKLGKTGNSFFSEAHRAFTRIFEFSQIYGGIDKTIEAISAAVSELKEMDDIITEISKVSDMSSTQLDKLAESAYGYASKYGKTVTDYLEGVTEMNRSGYYGQQGIDMANVSVLAQAAGSMTADVANAYLLATDAAYQFSGSAEKLNAVLDGQNMITNRNSVNMTDMASATTEAGSMAAQAGVKVEELSALIGTAVARTKESGSEVGTALKALFINLQNTQNAKIVDTFDSLGISMTKVVDGSEQLKTPIELLKELSEAYNTLPDGSVDKANILTNIGGKHHANTLSSILVGYSDFERMLNDYSEGMGSASVEAEKSANNWSGSLNKLSNSWTSLVGNFANSDVVTGGINMVNSLVQAIDSLTKSLTPLGTIGVGAGLISFLKNLDKLKIMSFA